MWLLAAATLVGVVHVHHAASHDSQAPFSAVLHAAMEAELDFVVLTEHVRPGATGPLPAASRAGLYERPRGGHTLVLVGAEFGTRDGHLLALDIPQILPIEGLAGREAIDAIHASGGFAVVPHPFLYGGWKDWDAPFDGLEVHNNAEAFWEVADPLLPLLVLRLAFDRPGALQRALVRPRRALEKWDELLAAGRRVVAFSGAEAHQNLKLFGWQIDPYTEVFRTVQTVCPDAPLTEQDIWQALRAGACWIRYRLYEARAHQATPVSFPSGRTELQLDAGRRVLEISQPPFGPP